MMYRYVKAFYLGGVKNLLVDSNEEMKGNRNPAEEKGLEGGVFGTPRLQPTTVGVREKVIKL